MRIAELVGLKTFRVADGPEPQPGPGEVLVQVAAVGICGSDMHYYAEGGIGDSRVKYPVVLGHEPAGVVLRTGANVSGIEPGDHFALEPAIPCQSCELCRRGLQNLCDNMRFMSSGGVPGFFRQRVTLPASNLIPIPKHVGMKEATLIEPIAVVLHSMKFASLQPGETAVVFGAGPIGLLTIAALKLAGASRIWAVEPVAHRREMAKAMGADAVLDTVDPEKTIQRDTSNRGVDVAFDCAAKKGTVGRAIASLAKAGRLVYTGIPSELDIKFDAVGLRKKELTVYNVYRSNHQSEAARDLLSAHARFFAPLVTHTRSLEDIQSAFNTVDRYSDGVGKMVVAPTDV
jgi:L-iditol 2-dehydrogenase